MYFRSFLIWILLVVLAIANAGFRNYVITPRIGEHGGHVISTVLFCLVIFIVSWIFIRWMGPKSRSDAVKIGVMWVILTVAFEFLAGHYLFKNSWDRLIADYNMARGRVWVLVLLASFFAPRWAAGVRVL